MEFFKKFFLGENIFQEEQVPTKIQSSNPINIQKRKSLILSIDNSPVINISIENSPYTVINIGDIICDNYFHRINLFNFSLNNNEKELYYLLEKSWEENYLDTLKMIFYFRDFKNGGRNDVNYFTLCLNWVIQNHVKILEDHFDMFIKYTSWKDLFLLFNTPLEHKMIKFYGNQILKDLDIVTDFNNIDLKQAQDIDVEISMAGLYLPRENRKCDNQFDAVKLFCKYFSTKTNSKIIKRDYRKNYVVLLNEHIDYLDNFKNIKLEDFYKRDLKNYYDLFFKKNNKIFLEFIEKNKITNFQNFILNF